MAYGTVVLLLVVVFAVNCNAAVAEKELMVADSPRRGTINCYVCNSLEEPDCFEAPTLKKKFETECPEKDGVKSIGCWMLRQWVNYDQSTDLKQHERVIRQCAYQPTPGGNHCQYRSGFGGLVTHCFCNNSNLCNFGSTVRSNPIFTIVTTLFFILILKAFY